jgi:RNA polymerase sigma factor (TIGR02999 family)
VQEAYVGLLGRSQLGFQSRRHFYAAVSQSMRHLLIDAARRRQRLKRGGDWQRVQFADDIATGHAEAATLLAIDEALHRLEREDDLQHKIVNLRYFAGLSIDAVAETLDVSPSTVDRNWKFARAWLHRELSRGEQSRG